MNLLEELKSLLKKDDRLVSDDKLLKNKIVELALKLDKDLIKLLLGNKKIKEHFFEEVDKTLIFDKEKFMKFVDNKEFLPDSYTAFKNKIGLTADKKYLTKSKEVVLSWPYKDCILEGGQEKEDEKRKEIFHNEILAPDEIDRLLEPKVFTNFKRVDAKGEHNVSNMKPDDNLIIKGNNLLALHSLKKKFLKKVKLIYIDPPYNTGGASETFTYNNSFNHSTWLTFMKNRLEVAKNFLREDGFIAITIDHVELFYLGALADEIFGEENRVGIVTIYINPKGRQHERFFSAATEYMLVYAKNISVAKFNKVTLDEEVAKTFNKEDKHGKYRLDQFIRARTSTSRKNKPKFWYPIYISKDLKEITLKKKKGYFEVFPKQNGNEFTWKTKPETFEERNVNSFFVAKKEDGEIKIYHKFYEQQVLKNIWIDKKYFPEFQGTNLLKKLLGESVFSYPKSLYAVLDTLKIMTSKDDIIMDFFGGSGTTAHATLELNKEDEGNRQFVLVEQLETHMKVIKKRIQKVMELNAKEKNLKNFNKEGSNFVYCELKEFNDEFIQKIEKAKDSKELLKTWEEMKQHAFLSYRADPKLFDDNIAEFKKLSAEEQKKLLVKCLDANNLYVNYSEIKDKQYKVNKEDIDLNKRFYGGF